MQVSKYLKLDIFLTDLTNFQSHVSLLQNIHVFKEHACGQ